MAGVANRSLDSVTLERVQRAAAGLPREKNGQPVSEIDRLLARASLTSLAVRSRGGSSLFSFVNGLLTEAMLDVTLAAALGFTSAQAQADYFTTVMTEIVSGRLIVREQLNFLQCNGIPDIQALAGAREGFESMAVLVRFAVKNSDARDWLEYHGREIPEWMAEPTNQPRAGWATLPVFKSNRRRRQVKLIEALIDEMAWPPLNIPYGGKASIKAKCIADHQSYFTDDGFDVAWSELVKAKLVRTENHDIYAASCGGLPTSQ